MEQDPSPNIMSHFSGLEDPRRSNRRHPLENILVITLCAFVCGANDWVAVETFGKAKATWFEGFLDLEHGIPSHDTFGDVFAALDPVAFAACFTAWVQDIARVTEGEVVAIDGKTARRSFDRATKKAALHMVSAWATRNRLSLGQLAVDDKSNEITAIPKLLQLLHLKGAIVTIDAMGCQKAIAAEIREAEADYVLALKANHGILFEQVLNLFEQAEASGQLAELASHAESADAGHGREEWRRVWSLGQLESLTDRGDWKDLNSVVRVESHRTEREKTSIEARYFISSLPGEDAPVFLGATREHWGVENGLHWCLDMAFREDESRVRTGNAAENAATIRRLALNLLKQEATAKIGIQNKRLRAGWDHDYLLKILDV